MLDQILVIVSVTALVMVTPGPDMVLVLRNTFAGGRSAGLQTSVGILSGNLVHITYCTLGIGLIISQSIVVFATLKYASAAYLIVLGVMSFRAGAKTLDTNDIERIFQSGLHEFLRRFIAENVALDQAIAQQFRFG